MSERPFPCPQCRELVPAMLGDFHRCAPTTPRCRWCGGPVRAGAPARDYCSRNCLRDELGE